MRLAALLLLALAAQARGQCTAGWTYYNDTLGSPPGQEGIDSCVKAVASASVSFNTAKSACPSGSHLLTITSTETIASNALYQTAFNVSKGKARSWCWGAAERPSWCESIVPFQGVDSTVHRPPAGTGTCLLAAIARPAGAPVATPYILPLCCVDAVSLCAILLLPWKECRTEECVCGCVLLFLYCSVDPDVSLGRRIRIVLVVVVVD